MADPLPFIDAHHHLQQVSAHPYPWLRPDAPPSPLEGDLAPLRRDYLIEEFLGDAARQNLVKSVHVQNGWDARRPVDETAWLQGIADRHGFPHGIVAYADLASPDVAAILKAHAAHANVRGIRQILNWSDTPPMHIAPRPGLMSETAWRRGFALLRTYGLSFDLQVFPTQFAEAYELCRAHPDIQVILNHAGMPIDRSPSGLAFWHRGMKQLAKLPNLAVKISGLRLAHPDCSLETMRSLALRVIDAFGVERCMFGSNFPVDSLWAGYDEIVCEFRAIAERFSAEEQHALFSSTAERVYRL